jgi:hypothetical protein
VKGLDSCGLTEGVRSTQPCSHHPAVLSPSGSRPKGFQGFEWEGTDVGRRWARQEPRGATRAADEPLRADTTGAAPLKEKLAAAKGKLSAWKAERQHTAAHPLSGAGSGTRPLQRAPVGVGAGGSSAADRTPHDYASAVPSSAELAAVEPRLKPPQLLVRFASTPTSLTPPECM